VNVGVVVFPGSNCDRDSLWVIREVLDANPKVLWHKDTDFSNVDMVILPGGFSYGDYLRTGAIARFSPVMSRIIDFANQGGLILGICNGFQVLLECGLLDGAMIVNKKLRFLCRDVYIRVEREDTPFSSRLEKGQILRIPIAHFEGNYFAGDSVLKRIEDEKRVLFRYCDRDGNITEKANLNGSSNSIAGLLNDRGNVLGMMPHPERASESILGSTDGVNIFRSAMYSLKKMGS